MKDSEKRIRELEIENIALQFQINLLIDKNDITIEDMKKFAKKSLKEFPESEKDSDIVWYLNGIIKGEV